MSIPGIGPVIASALAASIDNGQAFESPRALAVWLGLTPRQYASGNRSVTVGIIKRGDRYLRTQLVHGARATIRWAKHRDDAFSQWVNAIVKRRGFNTAVVAIAHKLARIAWGVLQRQTPFQTRPAN